MYGNEETVNTNTYHNNRHKKISVSFSKNDAVKNINYDFKLTGVKD
ncbi:MAG: hypothetical protein ACJ76F_07115 [Bacteroidia bacterium]